jgi:hypothetical protein
MNIQYLQHHLLKRRLFFPHFEFLAPCQRSLTIIDGFIFGFSFLFLVNMSVFMPLPYYFNYWIFEIYFEIKKCEACTFILLSQDCFNYLGFFVVPINCRIYICKHIYIYVMLLEFWYGFHWICKLLL